MSEKERLVFNIWNSFSIDDVNATLNKSFKNKFDNHSQNMMYIASLDYKSSWSTFHLVMSQW